MKKKTSAPTRLPVILFSLVILAVLACSASRMWTLRALYTDAALRQLVQREIQYYADQSGILLSSIYITEVNASKVEFDIREYRRGRDSYTHDTLVIAPSANQP